MSREYFFLSLILAGEEKAEWDNYQRAARSSVGSMLDKAKSSGLKHFANFAIGLARDYAAVKNALIYEWSSGQVEKQVNKLKFIKRHMYGRAKFDLLRKKVLYQSAKTDFTQWAEDPLYPAN